MGTRGTQRFARLRFRGERFESPIFPVEALSELATYRELVLEAAKAIWFADNPHRVNAPRGFDAAFSLFLEQIEEGSSMPVLVRAAVLATAIQGMTADEAAHYFDAGRQLVAEVVDAASQQVPLPKVVAKRLGTSASVSASARLGHRFATFGNKLLPSESIQLAGPEDGPPTGPTFDLGTRDWIIRSTPSEYTEDVEYIGEIVKADKVKHAFELFADGRRHQFEAPPAMAAELLTWMRDDTIVRVKGKAVYRTIGGFQRLEVASIVMVQQDLQVAASAPCPLPVSVQLADIARLDDGWLDGDGFAYAPHALARAREIFEALLAFGGIAMPYIYPSADGEFRAEWNHPDRDIVVTLDPDGKHLRLLAVEVGGDVPTRRKVFEANADGVKMLASVLEPLLNAEAGP